MSAQAVAASPLKPVYPFNEPGQPIVLHDGLIGGLAPADVAGVLTLVCRPEPGLEWAVGAGTPPFFANLPSVDLVLRRPCGDMRVQGVPRDADGGWSNAAVFGKADAPLARIVTHWFNLPRWSGQTALQTTTADGGQHLWSGGRWSLQSSGWEITFDVRPDHSRVWAERHKDHVYVMTHVMELRRADGSAFTAEDAEPVLDALHIGISFALGHWAAPMLPVGQDVNGQTVWESWSALFCDYAQPSSGWWYDQDAVALAELLDCIISEFGKPDRRMALGFQMKYAITATRAQGFMEQRVSIGAAGLEHVMWQNLVRSGRVDAADYKKPGVWPAARKLRTVLTDAGIPSTVDTTVLPAAATFAASASVPRAQRDGAEVVSQVRNRLVHPKDDQAAVYQKDGLLAEVWLLTRHYLTLLILHSLGYRGSYRDLTRINGRVGSTSVVPWR